MIRYVCFWILAFIVCITETLAQSAGDYRSNVILPGNWSDASSWERHNGTAWVAAATPPSSTDGTITILSGDRIDLIAATTIDQVVVASGGELFIFNLITPFICTLNNGPGNDIENNGMLFVSANSTLSGGGNIINNSGGTFTVRNQGILSVSSINNGTMQVSGTGNFANTTVTNNATFTLINFTLNLNNATLSNNGLINFTSIGDSFIAGTGNGFLINEIGGTIFKTAGTGTAWVDPAPGTVTFTNKGVIKGIGDFIFRSNALNTGVVTPGNSGAGALGVNPVFVTGKTPSFNLDIVSTGAFAGINYDRVNFSNTDFTTINITGSTLNVTDNASDLVGTVYTLFSSTSTIVGPFATVNLPPTLGNLIYTANSITVEKMSTQARYTWTGGNSAWTTAANWTPVRTTPAVKDVLMFSSGGTVTITNVPTEAISALTLTNNTTVNLQASGVSKTLTVGNTFMNYLTVEAGSALHVLNNSGILLNITIANGSRAAIGGVVDMQNGTFNAGDNVLQLHTTAVPLTRTSGQFAIGSNGAIEFGDLLHTTGPAITLTNSIFVSSPVISRLTVCRTNGAVFGNQDITVNQAIMSLGNLTTSSTGRIFFSTAATNPIETSGSKIIGYAEMLPRIVSTAAVNFLGVSIPAGSEIGTVGLTRITGPTGINTFNGFSSIASKWNVTATVEPSPARSVSLSWLSDFDNGVNTGLLFQDYRYDTGPNWISVGGLLALQSTANPRISTATTTLKLTGSWTISDQLNVLPVILTTFNARQVKEVILLEWKTSSEQKSDFFEVQRLEPEEGFTVVGNVRAKGNSKNTSVYNFEDATPVSGRNYYRLRMVDLDKSYEYSPIISIEYKAEPELLLYPNPNTGGELNLLFPQQNNAIINITNTHQSKFLSIPVTGATHVLNLAPLNLPAGVYLVTYESGPTKLIKRLVIR